ncbi:MAG: fimbrillin family protein [Rikenellaceae bacterium]
MNRIFLSIALLFSFACSRNEPSDEFSDLTPELPLNIYVSQSSYTKASLVEEPKDMGSIGLYCAMTSDSVWSEYTAFTKMDNRRYEVDDIGNWTIYENTESWGFESLSDKYSFFAYSPHSDVGKNVTPYIENGELMINYKVPTKCTNQSDLMFAIPRKDILPQIAGRVSLTFCHILSTVCFSVDASNSEKITSIKILGVNNEGFALWDYKNNVPIWELTGVTTKQFTVDVSDYTQKEEENTLITPDNGYLMMIPQELSKGAEVVLTLEKGGTKTLNIPAATTWEAGKKYNYVIKLSDGDSDDDDDFIYDSSQISNCYIINPTDNEPTFIQIPIEDRINDFWMSYSGKNSTKIYSDSNSTEFYVKMIWEDFDGAVTPTCQIVRDSDEKMAVQLTFPDENQEGNYVFAIYYDNQEWGSIDDLLWSWHLWFTDYNPTKIANANRASIEQGKDMDYILSGYNGAVHRYVDGDSSTDMVWSVGGIYEKKFIMDRNIGERNTFSRGGGVGSVYYQFGRKDPFPGLAATYSDGSSTLLTKVVGSSAGLATSVEFSDHFIWSFYAVSQYNWYFERDRKYIWYDDELLADVYTTGKSIFDPSPLGWRLPVSDTWSSFNNTGSEQTGCSSSKSVGVYRNFGYRDPSDESSRGILTDSSTTSYVWSANQSAERTETGYGICLFSSESIVTAPFDMFLSCGLPVRAVEE